MRHKLLISIIVGLIMAGSAPWWINLIPWERIVPVRIVWKQPVVAFLPADFEIDVTDPYNRPNITSVEVLVEVDYGTIILLRKGEIIEEEINKSWFADVALVGRYIYLLRVTPRDALLNHNRKSSSVVLDFDSSSLIPRAIDIGIFRKGDRHKFGELEVQLFYEVNGKTLPKEIVIPMYLVKN